MKRTVVALMLLVAALAASIYSHFSVMRACDELTQSLTVVRQNAADGDFEATQTSLGNAAEQWEKQKTLYHVLIHHSLMTDLEISMKKAAYFSECGNMQGVFDEVENSIENISHIKESSSPSISNIF